MSLQTDDENSFNTLYDNNELKIYKNKYILIAFTVAWVIPPVTGFSLGSNFNINNRIYFTTGYTSFNDGNSADHYNRCLLIELNGVDKKIYAYSKYADKISLRLLFCGYWKLY